MIVQIELCIVIKPETVQRSIFLCAMEGPYLRFQRPAFSEAARGFDKATDRLGVGIGG